MINLEGAMALDSEAGAVAARVFNRSGNSKSRASAVQWARSTLAPAPLAALGLMQLQRRVACRYTRPWFDGQQYDTHRKFEARRPECGVQRSAESVRWAVLDGHKQWDGRPHP